jgi:hypothetical protein
MKLAETIEIKVAGKRITLRPSLRHAIRLERREGSFARLMSDIMDGSLSASCEIIADHCSLPFLESRVFDAGLDTLKEPLLRYVVACAGIDDELGEDAPKEKPGKSVSFPEHLAGLYRIATGWLGWPPNVALDATPAEIMEAYKGRVEMLKAIFGSSEPTPNPPADFGDKLKTALQSFEVKKVKRQRKPA